MGAPAVVGTGPFVDDVLAFAEAFPLVELELCLDDERKNQIEAGFDVAIRMGWLEDSALRARQLFTMRRRLCAAPALIAKLGMPQHPADLLSWPWVQETMLPRFIDLAGPEQEPVFRIPLSGRLSTNQGQTAKRFAVAGTGCIRRGGLSGGAKNSRQARWLKCCPTGIWPRVGVYAVWPANTSRNSLSMHFVDFLHARVAPLRERS